MHYAKIGLAVFTALALMSCLDLPESPALSQTTSELSLTAGSDARRDDAAGQLTGGGYIREGEWHISFGGQAAGIPGQAGTAAFVVRFHNVSVPALSGRTFQADSVDGLLFQWPGDPNNCHAAASIVLWGTFDREPGWSVRLRLSDAGKLPDVLDTVRIRLFDPAGEKVYDSTVGDLGGEFPRESNCAGTARTNLDGGNLTLRMPAGP